MADDLAKQLRTILNGYSQAVQDATKEAVDEVTKEALSEIKPLGSYLDRTGMYRKGFYAKEEREGLIYRKRLANHQYQLTHLLENGHLTRKGKGRIASKVDSKDRTRAFVHWEEVEEYVDERLPNVLTRKLREAGG